MRWAGRADADYHDNSTSVSELAREAHDHAFHSFGLLGIFLGTSNHNIESALICWTLGIHELDACDHGINDLLDCERVSFRLNCFRGIDIDSYILSRPRIGPINSEVI